MASGKMILYWGSGSAPCWRPMLVLAEKGLSEKCTSKRLEFSKGQHKGTDILAINPRGQLPTFKDGDVVVNESGAICMYLEEKYSDNSNRLLPQDVNERAEVYQRMFETSNIISNIQEPIVRYRYRTKAEDLDHGYLKEKTVKAKEEIDRWNTILKGKDYLCGSKFTMADVFFYPYLALFVRSGAKLADQPELKRYYETVSKRPSVQATWPPHWKEGPGPGTLSDL
ncbi:glutathione S-transferase A-like [Ruditapes philippinarum]|uniref:glutathione S-transferase A-like n=1 Tax=Ruditapes philippinarum TaxID=129788 RepID=UPI00295C3764|nr:glutathione S-transferase A-like [Ruditapes philippinarum]